MHDLFWLRKYTVLKFHYYLMLREYLGFVFASLSLISVFMPVIMKQHFHWLKDSPLTKSTKWCLYVKAGVNSSKLQPFYSPSVIVTVYNQEVWVKVGRGLWGCWTCQKDLYLFFCIENLNGTFIDFLGGL